MATLIDLPTAARILGISRQAVWGLVKRKRLTEHRAAAPHLPSRFQYMVDRAEVEKRLETAQESTP
jgi:hypothetical protein